MLVLALDVIGARVMRRVMSCVRVCMRGEHLGDDMVPMRLATLVPHVINALVIGHPGTIYKTSISYRTVPHHGRARGVCTWKSIQLSS